MAILRGSRLHGANLAGCSAFSTIFAEANISCADLSGARLVANFQGANSTGTNLSKALMAADMRNQPMGLMRVILVKTVLRGANLAGADLSHGLIEFADLSGANLSGASLRFADAAGANFRGAILQGTDFQEADVSGARFSRAGLLIKPSISTRSATGTRSAWNNRQSFVKTSGNQLDLSPPQLLEDRLGPLPFPEQRGSFRAHLR